MQQGILFHTLLAPNSGAYMPQVCLTLAGYLDTSLLKQAWEQVLAEHQALRAAFHWENRDKPFQVVYRQVNMPWEYKDWRKFSSDEQQTLLENFLEAERKQGFDLKKPPLMRLNLLQLAEEKYQLVWTQHHLILDGWSSGLIIKEVFERYNALHQGQDLSLPVSRPYGDYIAWLKQQDLSTAKKFWQNWLKGFTAPTSLRVERNLSDKDRENKQEEQQRLLAKNTTSALQFLAQQHQLTLNTLVQGAFALLLSRYSDEEDIVFGATCSDRPPTLAGVESMIGLFINTLPVRVHVPRQGFLIPWLQNLQAQQAEVLQYEYSPLLNIQEWSDIPARLPLFETILVFENYPVDISFAKQERDLRIHEVRSVEWTSFPLTVLVGVGSQLSLKIKYNSDRFDAATIARMLGHFQTLLEGIVANPQQRLGELPLLAQTEQRQLLVEWNDTQTDYPQNQGIHELFEAQVEKTPDAVAVIFEDRQLTYRELNARANQLAFYLQALGIKTEVLVGICLERSLEMVIGILGILKAGGAYVPIDPTYPQERLAFMLADTEVPVLLTQERIRETLPVHQAKVIYLDKDWEKIAQQAQANPVSQITSNNSVYVIYTSGSTGTPKGVINTHRGLCNRLFWMQEAYQLTATDRVLQKTPFSFDVSVWEFLWTLLNGASLVVARPGGHQDSAYLVKLIASQQITTLHFVPSMLQVFLEEPGLEKCKCLKRVISSGEVLPIEIQKRFFERFDAELYNLYGPTEAAIDVTYWTCQRAQDKEHPSSQIVPIGRPIANTQIYLLDSHEQLVPIGVPGEIHIGGEGLARGYLNRPELTAEKFIPNSFINSKFNQLYKTGDLACFLPDGNIEFLGRLDYQIKMRGFRIELGEIEAVLSKHPDVLACAVVARENYPMNKHLVAYIQAQRQDAITNELSCFLEEKLPKYMIPEVFVILDKFPLTPNGKLDRKALPAPNGSRINSEESFVAPHNSAEEKIAAIWMDILKVERVGVYDNFFKLGGNSLLAIRVNSRLRQTFELDLPLRTLFEKPTIAGLAERILTMHMIMQQLSSPSLNKEGIRKEIEI
jgi:amino acid adenylation domain-containing protein